MKFGKFLKNIIPKTLKERIKTEVLYLQNRKFLLETKRHYKKVLGDVRKKEKYSFGVYVVFDSTFGAYELVDLLKKDTRFSVKIVIIPDVSRGKNHMKHQYLETKNFFINKYGNSGFSRALVQKQDRTESDFSTVLIFNILMSCVLYAILFFASPAIAKFYKTPELRSLQRVFFLVIILNSLTVVQNAQLQILVDFRRIAIINTITTILSGVIGIIFAYKGTGPWAIVAQRLSYSCLSAICYWVIGKWKPKTGFSKKSFKQLFSFGSKLLISGFLSTTLTNINNLVIGKYYNPESLGHYTRAQQFPELTSGCLNSVISTSTFPLLASLQDKKEELIKTVKKLLRMTSMLVFPAMVGLAVLSKPIILVLLGEKWLPAAKLMFWLSISYILVPLSTINLNVLNAIGRSDIFLKVDILKIPIIILVMIITFPISIKAVVIGKASASIIYFVINAFMLGKLYNFGAIKQLLCAWKYIISSIIMGIIVMVETFLIPSDLILIIVGIISGAVVYALLLFVLKDEEFFITLNKIKGKLKKNG